MKKFKLGVLGLMSVFVLSLGLDASISKDISSTKKQPVMKLYTEHGEQI
jgi:hypothetical protein